MIRFERAKQYAMENASEVVDLLEYIDEKTMHCIWVFTESLEKQVAWFQLKERLWLEVAMEPDNWPGLSATLIWWEDDDFRDHLLNNCRGWYVRSNRGAEHLRTLGVVHGNSPLVIEA